jgi:putative aldouronate transport system permease protein
MTTATRFRKTTGEKIADVLLLLIMLGVVFVTLYPFVYVISMSISDPVAVLQQKVWLWPVGFSPEAYKLIFETQGALRAYYNTIWYTVVGTFINVTMTVLAAYPLSRRTFVGRKFIMIFIVITMFFSGGLIPTFLLVQELGLYNTRWAMVIPTAASAFLIIIARTFFQTSIPESLIEAAKLDGANDVGILWRIVLPLSKPILAVLTLFYAVSHWNDYFTPLVYLPDADLQPLSIFLAKVIIQNNQAMMGAGGIVDTTARSAMSIQLKYALIIVVIVPIVCVYPFLQKHFAKGVLIGSLKE